MKLQVSLIALALFGAFAFVQSCPLSTSFGINPLLSGYGGLSSSCGALPTGCADLSSGCGALSPPCGFSTMGLGPCSLGSLGLSGGGCGSCGGDCGGSCGGGCGSCGGDCGGSCGCNQSRLVIGLKLPSLKEKLYRKLRNKWACKCKHYSGCGSSCGGCDY